MKSQQTPQLPFCEDELHTCYSYMSVSKGKIDIYFKINKGNRALKEVTQERIPDPDNEGKYILVVAVKVKFKYGIPLLNGWNHIPWVFLLKDDESSIKVIVDKPGSGGGSSKGPTSTYPRA